MAYFDPPSFSFGLDFDLDSEPQQPDPGPNPVPVLAQPQKSSGAIQEEADDDFESPPVGPAQDSFASDPPRALKRLRRLSSSRPSKSMVQDDCPKGNLDDDIEEFSSQEDNPKDDPAAQCHSVLSSTKLPLHGLGVLTSKSASQQKMGKDKGLPKSSGSASMGSNIEVPVFPKTTVSPLRRFQLIDSDSDDFDEAATKEVRQVRPPRNNENFNPNQNGDLNEKKVTRLPTNKSNKDDLWKDFCSEKSFHLPTPAFDEVCEEYFRSVDVNQAQKRSRGCSQISNSANKSAQPSNPNPLPPAHCYFFHDDLRIQKLVRDRLPYFSPLGTKIGHGYQQHDASVIDYMSQFSHGESSKNVGKVQKNELNSTRQKRNAKKANGKEISQESENWINPKSCAGIPKDAGKRRVHAVGKSAGHWYTDASGRRVYVSSSGQEMTGQLAYRHYRKESGAGFKKSKKKTSKRTNAAKKK